MINNQYEQLLQRIVDEGEWIYNERTGKRCLTLINADLEYDVENGLFPLCTTRKSYWKAAIAEMIGYLRGYTNAQDFADLGSPTWFGNANENEAWLNNPSRSGQDDCGFIYGAVARGYPELVYGSENDKTWLEHLDDIDTVKKVYDNLKNGIDDRGEIISFWNPGVFHLGCLRPCMYDHQFSLVNGKLYLNSVQRSVDSPLGLNFNQCQVFILLALMAQITGHKPAKAYHKLVNCHIYEDQLDLVKEQLKRQPYGYAKLNINPDIKTLEDLETWVTLEDFELENYEYHPAIAYPFSV